MEIRRLTTADIPELRELAIRVFKDSFSEQNTVENMETFLNTDYTVEAFERDLAAPGARYYFISEDGVPAGYMSLRYNSEADHYLGTNHLELHRLYVDHAFHGRNFGHKLMQLAIDTAIDEKREWLWLGVWEHNLRAQKFYKKWGFERFSEHVFQVGDDPQTDWLMRLKI